MIALIMQYKDIFYLKVVPQIGWAPLINFNNVYVAFKSISCAVKHWIFRLLQVL